LIRLRIKDPFFLNSLKSIEITNNKRTVMMKIKSIETTSAGYAPALKLSSPAHAEAWALEGDDVLLKRRFLPQFALLLTALSFLLCLSTFSASATSTKAQLDAEIKRAETLLDTTRVSDENGWNIPIDSAWATRPMVNYLQAVINTAKNSGNLNDYDAYLLPLSDAQTNFLNAINPSGLMYNYNKLQQAITAAEDSISPAKFVVNADGKDVPGAKKWAPQDDFDAFKKKINDARNVKDGLYGYGNHAQNQTDAKKNQAAINDSATVLSGHVLNFMNDLENGYMPDYADLKEWIASAQYLSDTTEVSADGADVSTIVYWIGETDAKNLTDSITAVRTFVEGNKGAYSNSLVANQDLVNTRTGYLNNFISGITVSPGTLNKRLYNYLGLNAAVADAEAALESITSADDGNNISPDDFWATPNDCNSLRTVIDTQGQTSYGAEAEDEPTHIANQALINAAADAIKQATATLRDAAQNGCKPDYSSLIEKIATTKEMLDTTGISVDGHEYDSVKVWTPQADRTALQELIEAADGHAASNDLATYGDYIANQNAVDAFLNELNEAYNTFFLARQNGQAYDPNAAYYTELPDKISKAGELLGLGDDGLPEDGAVVASTDFGKDVPYGTMWIPANNYNNLTQYSDKAKEILATPGSYTKSYIIATHDALSEAINAATADPQMGLGANPDVLKDEIEAAQPLKDSLDNRFVITSVTGDGKDVIFGKLWVPQTDSCALDSVLAVALKAYQDKIYQGDPITLPGTLHSNTISPLEYNLRTLIVNFKPNLTTDPADALPDTTLLAAECDSIYDLVYSLAVSEYEGKDVKKGDKWVPEKDKTALLDSITTARDMTAYSTHAALLAKIDELRELLSALQHAEAEGSKTPYIVATPGMLPNGFVGAVYNAQVVDASLADVAFSISNGALPDGLSLDASSTGTPTGSGRLTGKPTRTGTFDFTIQAAHTSIPDTETLTHSITIYDAPAFAPNAYDEQETGWVSVQSDIVLRFPAAVPMNTEGAITITLNGQPYKGGYSWDTDTTLVILHPLNYYEYEMNYTLVIAGLVSKDGYLAFDDCRYVFHTGHTPPIPPISRSVTILPLPEGVMSDPLPGRYWVSAAEGNQFSLKLTVPPDKTPTLITNRIINGKTETLTGDPDPEMPKTRFLFTVRQIREAIEITVALSPPHDVGNEIADQGVRIRASAGKLYVETPQPARLSVYSAAGVLQVRKSLTGSSVITLPKGIYIVRLNEMTYKVVVP
jgi:hypothetical protein